jgi:hypothetical protein
LYIVSHFDYSMSAILISISSMDQETREWHLAMVRGQLLPVVTQPPLRMMSAIDNPVVVSCVEEFNRQVIINNNANFSFKQNAQSLLDEIVRQVQGETGTTRKPLPTEARAATRKAYTKRKAKESAPPAAPPASKRQRLFPQVSLEEAIQLPPPPPPGVHPPQVIDVPLPQEAAIWTKESGVPHPSLTLFKHQKFVFVDYGTLFMCWTCYLEGRLAELGGRRGLMSTKATCRGHCKVHVVGKN